jgi:hypothetical protein
MRSAGGKESPRRGRTRNTTTREERHLNLTFACKPLALLLLCLIRRGQLLGVGLPVAWQKDNHGAHIVLLWGKALATCGRARVWSKGKKKQAELR